MRSGIQVLYEYSIAASELEFLERDRALFGQAALFGLIRMAVRDPVAECVAHASRSSARTRSRARALTVAIAGVEVREHCAEGESASGEDAAREVGRETEARGRVRLREHEAPEVAHGVRLQEPVCGPVAVRHLEAESECVRIVRVGLFGHEARGARTCLLEKCLLSFGLEQLTFLSLRLLSSCALGGLSFFSLHK